MTIRAGAIVVLALALTAVTGCRPDDQATRTADPRAVAERLGPALMARLDSANAAFREGRFEVALQLYRSVATAAPDESVGWFGVYMAEEAVGNQAAADSALERARQRAPGASLIRPDTVAPEDGGDG
ncbi:MAG: hypothetical protein RQ745_02655 [Longimicrobiales bacterium]|nr:hypothetical protein [Longimicrobiales bacterium]